jgi:hypothetical protein
MPFGSSSEVATAFCRSFLDSSVSAAHPDLQRALAAYTAMLPDSAWGHTFAPVATQALADAPVAGSAARICSFVLDSERCIVLRQAIALVALAKLHSVKVRASVWTAFSSAKEDWQNDSVDLDRGDVCSFDGCTVGSLAGVLMYVPVAPFACSPHQSPVGCHHYLLGMRSNKC